MYHQVRNDFERFICQFFDSMQQEIISALPKQRHLSILMDPEFRKNTITRQLNKKQIQQLTPRELQCLELISQGMSSQNIASFFHLSNETVTTHAKSIRHKMDAKNITEAVSKAFRMGLL